jgi:hypothetical protein
MSLYELISTHFSAVTFVSIHKITSVRGPEGPPAKEEDPIPGSDGALAGDKDRRPGLDRLMEDTRKRRLDGILVWKLDRLGRRLKHLFTMFEEFHDLGF